MSASQDKKKRVVEREQGTERRMLAAEKEDRERKKSKKRWIAGSIIVALLIAVIIIGNSNLFYTGQTALKVGDESYSVAEVNYFYHVEYNNLYGSQYGQWLGIDTSKPLSEQAYSMGDEYETWDDYFRSAAEDALVEITAMCSAAKEAGMSLTDEDLAEIDAQLDDIAANAKLYGYGSANKYLTAAYGNGVTTTVARRMMQLSALASKYSDQQYDSYEYTDAQLAETYAEHADEYDTFDYLYYFVPAETVESTDDDGETTSAPTEETMADARAVADQIAAAANTETDADAAFTAAVAEYGAPVETTDDDGETTGETTPAEPVVAEDSAGSSFSSAPYAAWMYSADRAENDVEVFEQENSGYYVVLYQGRGTNDYPTVSVRHILVRPEDTDGDGVYSDEETAAAKDRIEEIRAEWESGEQTEERFAELANEYSEDPGSNTTGGLYEHIYHGQMVEEFNDFCFDESRKPGDVGVVYNENTGYHLIYFVGEGETYSTYLADQLLRSDDFSAWREEFLADWSATECRAIKYVG